MRRLFLIGVILFVVYKAWPVVASETDYEDVQSLFDSVKTEISNFGDRPEVAAAIDTFLNTFHQMAEELKEKRQVKDDGELAPLSDEMKNPELSPPAEHVFSIHQVELGDTKDDVEQLLGAPKRATLNEYGVKWYAYHDEYRNFTMVAYNKRNTVSGLYTTHNLIASTKGIELGSSKEAVREALGEPMSGVKKGRIIYQMGNNDEYDLFHLNDSYITLFYDKHSDNTVTSIQIIHEELEQQRKSMYSDGSEELMEGFEFQLFDLTNAARVQHGLSVLKWSDKIKMTARKHSKDIAENGYFSHTNQEGESPFDRMQEDGIPFTTAGENLAAGQYSSIYAHEGLMNSAGHRKNILQEKFEHLGVGVAFGSNSQPYFTENFFAD